METMRSDVALAEISDDKPLIIAIERTNRLNEQLGEVISELHNRLELILRPQTPKTENAESKTPMMSALAEGLTKSNDGLYHNRERILDLIERLDI